MLRILLTGGGTGGHITPLIAVAQELQTIAHEVMREVDLYYIGAPGPYRGALEALHINVRAIASSKIRRYFALQNAVDAIKFPISILQALWSMLWIMPDVVFSKGGPGAFSVVLAARFYRIPVIIHESDAIPGLTNRLSSKFAQKIILSFTRAEEYFNNKNTVTIGNPIRPDVLNAGITQENAKKLFGFSPEKQLILITGGSQGAMSINNCVIDFAPHIIPSIQILHQTGMNNFEGVSQEMKVALKDRPEEDRKSYKAVPYLQNDLKDAYTAADLVIGRAGSATIFELAAYGKPSILIPLPAPQAAHDHQVANAYEYAQGGASTVIEETNLQPNLVITQIKKILETPGQKESMAERAHAFAKPDAARRIAEEIIRYQQKALIK